MTPDRTIIKSRQPMPALVALCARIVPAADAVTLAGDVDARIGTLDAAHAARLIAVVRLFDSHAGGLLAGCRAGRFHTLPAEAQDTRLHGWERSRLPALRTGLQAMRRLVLATWYVRPEAMAAIGQLPPLHLREPLFPWEGPLPGDGSGVASPVAASARPPEGIGGLAARPLGRPERPVRAPTLTSGSLPRAEVCVIGSGVGGAVAACRLAEGGVDVVILEAGRDAAPRDFDGDEGRMIPRLYADRGARATDDLSVSIVQAECVGGGSTVNWLLMLRPPEWVLDDWARAHGGGVLAAAELVPALDLVERETETRTVPPDAHSPANRVILDGARALGWRAEPGRINVSGCMRAGLCGIGCPYGARRGAGAVHLPRALAAGARLYSRARAVRLERRRDAGLWRVTVEESRPDGSCRIATLEAERVVLAAGAVATPVLLQRSGLGGAAVGQFLRLHPTTAVSGVYDRTMYAASGIPMSAWCNEFHYGSDGYGFWIESPPLQPVLAALAMPGFGESHRRHMAQFTRMANSIVLVRDGAQRDRSSGSVRAGRGGVRIRYRLAPRDAATLAEGVAAAVRLHHAAGASEVVTLYEGAPSFRPGEPLPDFSRFSVAPNRLSLMSAHVNGTCRIGTSARLSACTPDGALRGVPDLHIADGSLLPTAPGVNPQATIMAAADRVAARVLAARRTHRGAFAG